ncbi:MAG: L-arabinose isomerase, partial [Acidobacteriaceae bacterium]|nr:L-arabinose isomerase [Acidobacteriaceae bacterium]
MQSPTELRAGLCGIGLEAYWPQFPGLKARLESFVAQVGARLVRPGIELVELGLIDSPSRAQQAGRECRRSDIDVLFVYVTTYALSN